ncbi:glycosyltransferase [Pseudoduganella sp. FT25W]|uniref:Glycosyltransferase n=1 Tax=Duganella alba TaxID=2666081 RepID=A0A6L5QKU8_9BURK|nr:glycosyltransferase [Duganella alba]MRX10078.1 glycosyltransferase [Duganella alba]MRX17727.1 glycosyltransferase [Duganella alba]
MRIVIDLQACQRSTPDAAALLHLAQQIARSAAPPQQVVVALSDRHPAAIMPLRHAFAGLAEVVLYELPPPDGATPADAPWLARASEQIRAAFLATLRADLVFAPGLDAALDVAAVSPLFDSYATLTALPAADDVAAIWPLFEQAVAEHAANLAATSAVAEGKPRLAYISPLPPEKSGIADYSAELLPQLARHYQVDVVIAQQDVSDAWIKAELPLRDLAYFEAHAGDYDRVLYHFGNSPMHQHMFGLLERHPGIVVLHDFYLGNLLDHMHHSGHSADAGVQALFESHGYSGLRDRAAIGHHDAVWKYPSNRAVLDQADGVIVHSELPKRLAADWYGPGMAAQWRALPLLRGLASGLPRAQARLAARQRLGLDPSRFVVCAFGLLGPTKLNAELLNAWQASELAADKQCQLVFVGATIPGAYCRELSSAVSAQRRVSITGFVSHEDYQTWLAACDVAVQLRTDTRGETSAAVLDCLLHGVPTVANAHGSTAELPPEVLSLLPDRFSREELGEALLRLRANPTLRDSLSAAGAAYVREQHAPGRVGDLYHDTIEYFARHSAPRHYRRLLAALGALDGAASDTALRLAAQAVGANHLPPGPRQLFVDISAMVQTDLKTGIQRVVRSILMALIGKPPAGYRIEPVYSPGRGEPYRYARAYMQDMLQAPFDIADDAPIDTRAGDLFLGLDLMMHGTQQNRAQFERMRARGVQIYFVVYDILPVLRPDVFPFGAEPDFAAWLDTIAELSDGLMCISRSVADELRGWLLARPPLPRQTPLRLGYFHLGADIDASAPSTGLPPDADQLLAQLASQPTLLMVGTLEPRKGHAQALAAFDLLWRQGVQANLVIVGKHGWMVDKLAKDLREHPEQGKQLHWLSGLSDEMLLKLYHAASGLLIVSEGEGFGLPLIEAAQHGLPIVARDLPVFREVAGEHATYFSGLTAEDLAATMRAWLDLLQKNKAPQSAGMPWLTWEQSAQALLSAMLAPEWQHLIHPEEQQLS